MRKLNIASILLLLTLNVFGQINNNNRLWVIKQNRIDKTYTFKNPDSTITYLKYLGKIHDLKHKQYKILNSIWIWGLSKRATNRILVLNSNNSYFGQYAVTMTYDLPDKISNNKLAFLNANATKKKTGCKTNTYIDFNGGPPKEIFVKCIGNSGDIWTLEK